MLRSIQGKLFSWPIAISTSSHSNTTSSPEGSSLGRPPVSTPTSFIFWKRTPASRPFSIRNSLGAWLSKIGMPSCSASSISQGDAFITRLGERTVTFTSMPPRRRLVRQQSMAVLPPPITTTRLPIFATCSKATEVSQSMPMWMLAAASLRPGMSRSLPLGAPVPMKTASKPSFEQRIKNS